MKIQLLQGNNKKSLCLRFNIGGVEADIDFWRSDISEVETLLLQQHLQETFGDHMQEVRKVLYERGYRDGKQKKFKRACFARCHELLEWEKK
jgi:hypothetical protein